MLRRKLRKTIVGATICVTVLLMISPSAFAIEPHEDPEIAKPVFSGISLLRYYSDSLDYVLQKNPAEVQARLEKLPFANIPQSLEKATGSFAASSISISHLVVAIDEDLDKLRALLGQSRLEEAMELVTETFARLSQANNELNRIEQATVTTGAQLKVSSAPIGSDLRHSYDEVLERIDRIREMLDLYESLLSASLLDLGAIKNITSVEEAAELAQQLAAVIEKLKKEGVSVDLLGILAYGQLIPTAVTLKIEPIVAFVGDKIRFEGLLTSEGGPLAGREVDILLNSSRYVTAMTDAYGHYQGVLQIPYWYIPELDVQALYYPQDKDIGVYLASLSPVVKVRVLFYEAELKVTVEDKAYPGLETTVTGRFDYGQSPPLSERKVEIYFDDVLVAQAVGQDVFRREIKIDPETDVGEHVVTVSSAAVGRYSSVVASAVLNVTRAKPILDLDMPAVAMIPGSVGLGGKLYSEVGPLSGASIKIGLGKAQVELVSSEDGAFAAKIKVGMGFGVIGSQDLAIQVLPQEPWHAPLNTTSSVLMVNVVNCGAFVAILLFLGIYLPGRLRRRLGAYPRRTERPAIATASPEPASTYSKRVTALTLTENSDEASREPRDRVLRWYRFVVRLLQGITKAMLGPQQTLREFAKESSRVLGPVAKYFIELTKIVERLLYSQYRATEGDVENSKQLSHKIEEETKLRVTTQPLLARQLRREGTGTQFEPDDISGVSTAMAFDSGGKVLATSPWRQLSTWLWVLLILAVAYFAFILLFLLPLLVALPA